MKTPITICLILIMSLSFGQSKDCLKYRKGKFKMVNERTGVNLISRSDSIQIEYLPQLEIKVALNIEWIDDCTLKLTLNKVIDNPNKYPLEDFVLISEIIETKKDSYIMSSRVANSDLIITNEFFIVE